MRFEIAPLVEADLPEVVEMEEITGLNRWGYDAYRRELLTNPGAVMFVARPLDPACMRRTIGFVAAAVLYDELHVNNIAAHPDYRRLGIGRALMNAVLDEGLLRGAQQCVLEVRASNVVAQSLYAAFGFRTNRRRKEYYRGPTEDALEMLLDMR
jgi:ribosomal-protein-alanine N-acetyltransferase